jgi:Ca2+-binding EF-hand superfamily protein
MGGGTALPTPGPGQATERPRTAQEQKRITMRRQRQGLTTNCKKTQLDLVKQGEMRKAREELIASYQESYEPLDMALKKISKAAAAYDGMTHGPLLRQGFMMSHLSPYAFFQQLQNNFHMKLQPEELGALILYFDKNADGSIDCSEFLNIFFKLGRDEKKRQKAKRKAVDLSIKQSAEIVEQKIVERAKACLKTTISASYSETDRRNAIARIAKSAATYDRMIHKKLLQAFEHRALTPPILFQVLYRSLGLRFSSAESAALIDHFDENNDGEISCHEFSKEFFRLGREQQAKDRQRRKKREKSQREKAELLEQQRSVIIKTRVNPVLTEFTEADFDTVLDKLSHKASLYDREQDGILKAFQYSELSPRSLRKTLHQTLGVKVTPPELSALITYFDNDKNGKVDSTEFVKAFFKLGQQRTREVNKKRQAHKKMMEARSKKWEHEAIAIASKSLNTRIVMPPGWNDIVEFRKNVQPTPDEFAELHRKASSFALELKNKSDSPMAVDEGPLTEDGATANNLTIENGDVEFGGENGRVQTLEFFLSESGPDDAEGLEPSSIRVPEEDGKEGEEENPGEAFYSVFPFISFPLFPCSTMTAVFPV